MTRRTNARLAGIAYLFYIAVALPGMLLMGRATVGDGTAAKVASLAQHAADARLAGVLELLGCFSALVLAVTLYAITRVEDADLAMLGLTCRVAEGITGAVAISGTAALLRLVTITGSDAPNAEASRAIAAFVFHHSSVIGATFFAVGSTLFCWLLLRGRMIPIWLAWLGVFASVLIAIGLPLQFMALLGATATQLMWIPMAIFEITVALWFIIKGVAPAPTRLRVEF
jgi:hypothetical protein